MPQPLSSLPQAKQINLGSFSDSPSSQRPLLALLAMDVIAKWSMLEGFVNLLFVNMLGANALPAAAVFTSIRSQAGQRDAFRAVVDAKISDDALQDLIFVVFGLYEGVSSLRNKIAHWTWGHSPNLPNAVLLVNPLTLAAHWAKQSDHQEDLIKRGQAGSVDLDIMGPQWDRSKIFAYTARDFEEESAKIEAVMGYVSTLANAIKALPFPSVADRILHLLRSEPEIDAELARLNKRRQNGA